MEGKTLADFIGYWPSTILAILVIGGGGYWLWKKKLGPFRERTKKTTTK